MAINLQRFWNKGGIKFGVLILFPVGRIADPTKCNGRDSVPSYSLREKWEFKGERVCFLLP